METFSALLAFCAGNSPVTGEFPAQRPVTRGFDFYLIWALTTGLVNNRDAGDLRRHHVHHDITVMIFCLQIPTSVRAPRVPMVAPVWTRSTGFNVIALQGGWTRLVKQVQFLHDTMMIFIENIKTTSMENVCTGVLDKNKEPVLSKIFRDYSHFERRNHCYSILRTGFCQYRNYLCLSLCHSLCYKNDVCNFYPHPYKFPINTINYAIQQTAYNVSLGAFYWHGLTSIPS